MIFHVPEGARNTWHPVLGTAPGSGNNGAFDLESPAPGWRLAIIASDGTDHPSLAARYGRWEHVSVHAYKPEGRRVGRRLDEYVSHGAQRTPTWAEMCFVKDLFWGAEDVVVQYHPRRSEYVNCHRHVLHLWRPVDAALPTPPSLFVGPLTEAPL